MIQCVSSSLDIGRLSPAPRFKVIKLALMSNPAVDFARRRAIHNGAMCFLEPWPLGPGRLGKEEYGENNQRRSHRPHTTGPPRILTVNCW